MRKAFVLTLSVIQFLFAQSQSGYWQQQVDYLIDVTLHDKEKTLDAFEKITYTNNSPDTLKFIWFHIWPNAYKNDKTEFSEQMLLNSNTKFYFSKKEERGYINRLDFKLNNITCTIEDHPRYIDVIKVILPEPLLPGEKITLTTPFHVQLPFNFSRGGYDQGSFQITQWYPKPAVYDKQGWHPMPYLDQGEFYSEFGSFDVRITIPQNYVVAATGELQNEDEKKWLMTRNTFSWVPIKKRIKLKNGSYKTIAQNFPSTSAETKTLRYLQNNVHDFAWFANKLYIVNHDTCRLQSGKIIDVFTYYTPRQKDIWKNSIRYSKQALRFYSSELDEYPFNVVSAAEGPRSFGGGMEYPTITAISPAPSARDLDVVLAHEIGHNWFYGILATNERDHPWMDEGINSFYDHRYSSEYYKKTPFEEKTFFESLAEEKLDQPIETSSQEFNVLNYALVAYYKTSEWLRLIEEKVGKESFDKAMKDYYHQWQFKHPQPEDFKNQMADLIGKDSASILDLMGEKGLLPNQRRSGSKIDFVFRGKYFLDFLNNNFKDLITVGPLIGTNSYDKFMAGVFITNIKLPLNRLKFIVAPLYAFGPKKLNGIGKLDYSFYPGKVFRKIDLFLNGSSFSQNEYSDSAGKKTYLGYQKIVPGIRFTFKENDPHKSILKRWYIQWKSFFINEDELRFSRDSVFNPPGIVTTVTKKKQDRTLNQLLLATENLRALYPYRGELKIEQAKDFVRTAFTGNYFFNYPNEGGLDLRLFAGKFFYRGSKTISKQFSTARYQLNMTGANGYQDYTYSNYFVGRNKFEGLPNQQIMVRDGGFKIRTDLLASPIGQTDDWLIAANLTSIIPKAINPLSLVPYSIPLKVFFDVGTYAGAWKQNADTDRFLYEAGLQLSLFRNSLNIYLPLIYSNVYKDYIQSTLEKKNRLLKTISFSIDISTFNLVNIDRNLMY